MWENGVIEDYESSTGIFIQSDSEEDALSWAENIGDRLFKKENPNETKDWKSFGHFCWIENDWNNSGWSHCLDFFQNIEVGQFPDFENMGTTAYKQWIDSGENKSSYEKDLNISIEKYFQEILNQLNFKLYKENNQGMGASKNYKNKYLKLQIVNDKGLINLDISSKFGKEDFRDAELVSSLIELNYLSIDKIGKWQYEKVLNKRLDLNSQAKLLSDNWKTLIHLYNFWNYRKTIKKIDKLGYKRSMITFGQE
jgi:hypothetical protein